MRDLDGRRRPGTLADLENFARLSQMSPEVHVAARKAVEAQDVPVAIRHLECWRAVLTLTDKPAQSGFVNGRAEAEDALQMLAIVFGGEASIDGTPVAHCSVNANSPLLYDRPMLERLLQFARYGLPCRGGGALTDSPLPDAQSNYERMFTLLTSVLSGVNFLISDIFVIYFDLAFTQTHAIITVTSTRTYPDLPPQGRKR